MGCERRIRQEHPDLGREDWKVGYFLRSVTNGGWLSKLLTWLGFLLYPAHAPHRYVSTLRGHIAPVYRLTWSIDSRYLVSASKDSTLKVRIFPWSRPVVHCSVHFRSNSPLRPFIRKIWSLKTNKMHTDLPGHTDEVYCVDFVADKIVSGGRDGAVKIWKH